MTRLTERILLRQQILTCTNCPLHSLAAGPVCFSGPNNPVELAIIGEAPGKTEDREGAPFLGPAGKLLRRGLVKAGIDPAAAGMLNTVSCYPDGTPTRGQVDSCRKNMEGQLDFLAPEYVVVLGNTALSVFWPQLRIGEIRGKWWWEETIAGDKRWFTGSYHPAAVLRDRQLWDLFVGDLQGVKWRMVAGGLFVGAEEECVRCGKGAEKWKRGIGACKGHGKVLRYGRDKRSLF